MNYQPQSQPTFQPQFQAPPQHQPLAPYDPKRDLGRFSAANFIYSIAMVAVGVIYAIAALLIKVLAHGASAPEEVQELIDQYRPEIIADGMPYIIASLLGILIFAIYRGRQAFRSDIRYRQKKMTVKVFLLMVCFLFLAQLIGTLMNTYMEAVLSFFGIDLPSSGLSGESTSWSMLFYSCIMAPISEELIFRGAGLHSLAKYGKIFAIVLTSLLFGIFHENFSQLYFAAFIGLGFGYIALEYSIFWSIIFHIFNNLVIAEGLDLASRIWPSAWVDTMYNVLTVAAVAVCILFLVIKWPQIKAYLQANRTMPGTYRRALRSFWFWFFCIGSMLVTALPLLALALSQLLQRIP